MREVTIASVLTLPSNGLDPLGPFFNALVGSEKSCDLLDMSGPRTNATKYLQTSLGMKQRSGLFLLFFLGTTSLASSRQHHNLDDRVLYGGLHTAHFSV
jgi:hypothetical protein